jgi:CRP/FNR family cyclic AMP-dependent transcriptional regulator
MLRNPTDHEEAYADGAVIVREGEERREMYVIQRGGVVVSKTIDGREVEIARLGRGDFFGEMSLLESLPRYATVRAVGETRVLVVEPGYLLLKIRRNPTFAFEMLQHMSRRLRRINQRLMELVASGAVSDEVARELQSVQAAAQFTGQGPETETSPEPASAREGS